jgi:hypothetical protein
MQSIENNPAAVLRAVQEPDGFGGAPPHWESALAAMPAGVPEFLDAAALPGRRAAAGLPAERDLPLCELAATVAHDPALRRFAWYLHWRVFVAPELGVPWGPPALTRRLGDRAGLFYELLALEFPARLAVWHRRLGYPVSVTTETVQQIASFEDNHLRGQGHPGIYGGQFVWLAVYVVNPYVRLGRFEYLLTTHHGVNAWRHTGTGQVLALANDGSRVADDGLCLPGGAPESVGWTARMDETPAAVTGFPIDPAGRILRRQVRLDGAMWTPCLKKGMAVLDLHIPAGGGMSWDAVTESFAQALAFFPRHHPDKAFVAVVCRTWFLDPRLAGLLPADAHILRLHRAVYLVPGAPDSNGLWFVFLRDVVNADPATLPRDTALRCALANFLEAGGQWNGGEMFLLREDLAAPCEGTYRNRRQLFL